MNTFFRLSILLFSLFAPRAMMAQAAAGQAVKVFPLRAARVLSDPFRPRVYAAVPSQNSVAVIDTTTLSLVALVDIGQSPFDMTLSADGSTLYTANNSPSTAISLLDLNTLQARTGPSLGGQVESITATRSANVFAILTLNGNDQLVDLDGATGAIRYYTFSGTRTPFRLRSNPAQDSLYISGLGPAPRDLVRYDIGQNYPYIEYRQTASTDQNGDQIVVSYGGQYLCLANSFDRSTALLSTADLSKSYGSFVLRSGAYPGPLAFTRDDSSVLMMAYNDGPGQITVLQVFGTQSLQPSEELPLSFGGTSNLSAFQATDLVVERTGSYVFVGQTQDNDGISTGEGYLTAFTTGAGSVASPALLPVFASPAFLQVPAYVPFRYQLNVLNGPVSFTATSLPPGLSLDPATGVISGVMTTYDAYAVPVTATNAAGSVTFTVHLYGQYNETPHLTSPLYATATVGVPFRYQITTDQAALGYTATGLPVGLSLDASTGVITGTPTAYGYNVVNVSVRVSSGYTADGSLLIVTRNATALPAISSATDATATVGTPFRYQITATNVPSAYGAEGLPEGLDFDAATGVVSGTPTAGGAFNVTLLATNARGTGRINLVLSIGGGSTAPVITSAETASVEVGAAFSYQIVASNAPTGYTATGLPAGLIVDTASGLITGTPEESGTFTIGLTATNANGTGTASLELKVSLKLPVATLTVTRGRVVVGSKVSAEVVISLDAPPPRDLTIQYVVKGDAINGTDYARLAGYKKIRAGETRAVIHVKPFGDLGGAAKKVLKLGLLPGQGYEVTDAKLSKIVITAPPVD